MDSLNVGIASWIIQDGNYGDFKVGQEAKFALEFYPRSLAKSKQATKLAKHTAANRYQICGQMVYKTNEVWVLDMGFLAYQEVKPPKFAKEGSWVEGETYISIDPFFYFEYLNKLPGMPNLNYSFRIEQIFLETTPWIKYDEASPLVIGKDRIIMQRDEWRESYIEVAETDAWNDDDGNAHYVLKCAWLGGRI